MRTWIPVLACKFRQPNAGMTDFVFVDFLICNGFLPRGDDLCHLKMRIILLQSIEGGDSGL